jgi:thiamine biosynthesis lipoprotein
MQRRTCHVERVMGTAVSFDIRCPVRPEVLGEAVRFLHRVDATFSVYREDSEISRIAAGELHPDDAGRDVREVLGRCEELRTATERAFDHRPVGAGLPHLDPSALVKGWSIDRAADILRDGGAGVFCVNSGGDVVAAGAPEGAEAWRVGIRHPDHNDRIAAVVSARNEAVATSGAYERGDHVWSTAREPGSLAGVTVVGPKLGTADALATAIFAGGEIQPAWLGRFPGYRTLTIDSSAIVRYSPELAVDSLEPVGTSS